MMGSDDEAIRVILPEGDRDLGLTIFAGITRTKAYEDDEPVVRTGEPQLMLSLRRIVVWFNTLSTVLKSRELKAILKATPGV